MIVTKNFIPKPAVVKGPQLVRVDIKSNKNVVYATKSAAAKRPLVTA